MPININGGGQFLTNAHGDQAYYLPLETPTNLISGDFAFNTRDLLDASGMTYLFVEYEDGSTWSSSPKTIGYTNASVQSTVFELGPMLGGSEESEWIPACREELSESEACIANWHFGDHVPGQLYNDSPYVPDSGRYGFPLYFGYGPNGRVHSGDEGNYPATNYLSSGYLTFNETGDSGQVMRLADFTCPPGAISVEMKFRPNNTQEEQYLFWHERGGLTVKLQNGHIHVIRGENVNGRMNEISLTSQQAITSAVWTTVRVGDDGSRLYIYIDDALDSTLAHDPLKLIEPMATWQDLVLVGGGTDVARSFHGDIMSLKVENISPDLSLPVPVVDDFDGFIYRYLWNVIETGSSKVIETNDQVVLKDNSMNWGEGAGIESWQPCSATGQSLRVSAQIVTQDCAIASTQVQIGFTNGIYLVYTFNETNQRVRLFVNDNQVWDSGLWNNGDLLNLGHYIGFEFSSSGWSVVSSANGVDWVLLIGNGNKISTGQFSENVNIDEPLTLKLRNAKGGTGGVGIVLDNFCMETFSSGGGFLFQLL